MDKKRKYSELNSDGGSAIYVAAGLPPELPLEIVRQIFEAFGKVESINVSFGVKPGQTSQEKESLVTVTFEQSDAEKKKVCLHCLAKIWVSGARYHISGESTENSSEAVKFENTQLPAK